ncbi:DUF2971 domain-containing protein [Methylocystis hirsuta]|uniref:DUF2971 domain-containing protein n=1 Tax=Methylocystis hirsuta TaxID=369798 RepID=A0A3M9XVJ4_9HYPH|nr:DUF2971 domain-containing protein [Methylocystis hirsuta]RNJ50930.1 DUF2971 domain-containing protein [Methylocystis hirsuta]
MRVYHFVKLDFGLEDVRRRRLKIATLNDVNDPFELLGFSSADANVRKRFQLLKEKLTMSRGMLCFSRHWRNPVLWSHYADGHRGMCLGFDLPDEFLVPVQYQAKRLEPNLAALEGDESSAADEMREVLSTKYSHWRYENELRCFVSLDEQDKQNGFYFLRFSQQLALREVIVGHSSTLSRPVLTDALGELAGEVSVCKARLAFRSFKVVRQRNRKLWE